MKMSLYGKGKIIFADCAPPSRKKGKPFINIIIITHTRPARTFRYWRGVPQSMTIKFRLNECTKKKKLSAALIVQLHSNKRARACS